MQPVPPRTAPSAQATAQAAPLFEPQFMTGYEPGETTASPPGAITWMTFDNISTHPQALPWAMSVYYETPGTASDRNAQIVDDPTGAPNKVLRHWLKNAVIDAGFQSHTKGRIQTGFPGELVDATEVYATQRMFVHEDISLLVDYPPSGNPWWIGMIIEEWWMGAAWQGHPNPSRINMSIVPYNGQLRLGLLCKSGVDSRVFWQQYNLAYALPVGEWLTVETGYRMGDAATGRMVVVITREATGERTTVFDITDWTYDPLADEPGGTGPVPLTHWNPQKLYSSDNVIHFIRDQGGVAQIYWDDFGFSGQWPKQWQP